MKHLKRIKTYNMKKFSDKVNEKSIYKDKYMTVGKLRELLDNYNDDMLVGVYAFEEGDLVEWIGTNVEDELYFKGDEPEMIYDLPAGTEILYIKGFDH